MRPLYDKTEWPPIAVYDLEATEWVNIVLACHVDEYGNRVHFDKVSDYVDWLFTDFQGQHVWAHAGGRYDHRFLIPEINRRGWDFRAAMSGGTIVLLTASANKKKIFFADSFRIMPNALKAIGKTIGLEKLDVDRSHMEKLTKTERIEYCYRDCDIALRGLQSMKTALTAVNADFAFTLASIASRWVRRSPAVQWERLYKPEKGKLVYSPEMKKVDKWSEPAYFGGRTEVFQRGLIQGPIYYYDIVSSYPTSMQLELPLYFQGYVAPPKKLTPTTIEEYLSHPGITECWVNVPKTKVAPLCVKYENRLTFPYGHKLGRQAPRARPQRCAECNEPLQSHRCKACGHTHITKQWLPGRWTNIELIAALKRGAEILPLGQARFESSAFLNPFVKTFYALRKQAKAEKDAFKTYAYKILLNSLYGKLVETLDRNAYVTSKIDIDRARENGAQILSTKVPGVYCVQSQEEGPFRHVAAGAYVTAYSRLRLLEGLEAAMSAGGKVYYCDTDSIMTNVRLDHMAGAELGQWQLEHIFQNVEIVLPKVYRAEIAETGEILYRCKGVPIVREGEPELSEPRWNAFKAYAATGNPEIAALLGRDGMSGFVADINAGTLNPRAVNLLRCLRGIDRKRDWSDVESWPLHFSGAAE